MKRGTFTFIVVMTMTLLHVQMDAGRVEAQSGPDSYSHRFPDANSAHIPTKKEYTGPLFRLSQNFPKQPQKWDAGLQKIMKMPFSRDNDAWHKYLITVRDYCFEGNIEVEFEGQDNAVRKWYHVPWQHWGDNGREGIHGMTKEATAQPQQLAAEQDKAYQTYAVGVYNSVGGFTIGNVWKNEMQPDPTLAKFEEGTVVFKILFTQAPPSSVPYLENPITWKAFAEQNDDDTKRTVQDVHLIQMDVMIRDNRVAKTGGWIFGNFCYNGALNNKNPWDNLVPVGITWGENPNVSDEPRKMNKNDQPFPPDTTFNKELTDTIINPRKELPPQHLGFGGRLNGPLDYYNSSCMSCHATAEYPALAPMNPQFTSLKILPGSKQWMRWFQNVPCGTPWTKGNKTYTMDYSLQLAISFQNFYDWKSATQNGFFNPAVVAPPAPKSNSGDVLLMASPGAALTPEKHVFKIRRGPEE